MFFKKNVFPPVFLLFVIICFFTYPVSADPFSDKEPAEIILQQPEDIKELVETGINIGNVNGTIVRAYITPDDQAMLHASGYIFRIIPETDSSYVSENKAKDDGLSYPTYTELTSELTTLAEIYSNICIKESAGQSVNGLELWWIRISDNIGTEEAEPEVHYISTMHGNEPLGTVMCLEFIKYLLENYDQTGYDDITELVNSTEIWIMPLMNPDGYGSDSRYNANGDDLNRSFPAPSSSSSDEYDDTEGKPPEVTAIMDWAFSNTPVLGANFHTGALVVNYPFDYTYDVSPDDDLFEEISTSYAEKNGPMSQNTDPSNGFVNGIVRGSVWYKITGGLQDWIYLGYGANHVTIELSDTYAPAETELEDYWEENRDAMMAYLQTVHNGVQGVITDASGNPLSAWVRIEGIDHAVYTDPDIGDYCRMLLPGDYTLIARAEGYQSSTHEITITADTTLTLNIEMVTGDDSSGDDGSNWPGSTSDDDDDNSGNQGSGSSGGSGSSSNNDSSDSGDETTEDADGGGSGGGGCFISGLTCN